MSENITNVGGKGSSPQESNLVADSPPAYSDLGYTVPRGPSNTGRLEDEVIVSLLEVEETITRNSPRLELTSAQKETIKRLTESLLKRNVREQGVLPTALQKQFALEHVVSKFDKTSRTGHRNNNGPVAPSQSESSVNSLPDNLNESPIVPSTQSASTVQPVISAPTSGDATIHGGRIIIGKWLTYSVNEYSRRPIYAYDDQVPRTKNCMIIIMVIFFFLGSPLSLFCTVPTVYWIYSVISK